MNRADITVNVYLDNPEQKKDLRTQAGQRDLSMTEFAKRILVKALSNPLFLDSLSDISDTCKLDKSKFTIVDLSADALEPFPAPATPTHWWHVDGVLVEQNGDSTSGTRVASGATAQEAADSILAACTTARGGTWRWVTPPTIIRHASHRDDNCPVCTRSFAATATRPHSYNPELNHED